MPNPEGALGYNRTNRLRGMLIMGVFLYHFCVIFSCRIFPNVGYLLVGAFFMLSGFGLMESYKKKINYLDDFIGNKTARLLVPVWIAGIIIFAIRLIVFGNYSFISNQAYLFDLISGGPGTTVTWFVIELIFFYVVFYLSFKYLKSDRAILSVMMAVALIMVLLSYQQQANWYASGMMFPVGLLLSRYRDKIESVKPYGLLIISAITVTVFSYTVTINSGTQIGILIFANLRCFLVGILMVSVLLMRENSTSSWLVTLLILNVVYFIMGVFLGYGESPLAIIPLLSGTLLLSGLNRLSIVTDFIGNISYEIYLIHWALIILSRKWFSDIWLCLIISLLLSVFFAYVIKYVSGAFFSKKKSPNPQGEPGV